MKGRPSLCLYDRKTKRSLEGLMRHWDTERLCGLAVTSPILMNPKNIRVNIVRSKITV